MELLIYSFLVFAILALIMLLSYVLGQQHNEKATCEAYESGIATTGDARLRFPVQFYMIAMFFVIFDLEAVFIIAWAVAFKDVGWAGYWGVIVFIVILLTVLIYEWRIGALDFGPKGKQILTAFRNIKKSEA